MLQPIFWRRVSWQSTPRPEQAAAVQGVYSQHIAQPFQPKWGKEEHETSFPLSPLYVQAFDRKPSSPELAEHILGTLPGDSGTGCALGYLSCTTFLQLRTTVIPDTVAIVAWTVDTSLERRESKGVTPNVTPQGQGELTVTLNAHSVHTPAPRHGQG